MEHRDDSSGTRTTCFAHSSGEALTERAWVSAWAFNRWAVEANRGRIYARNLVGERCVFTVDLPRIVVPSAWIG
jgi:hypothetical protein